MNTFEVYAGQTRIIPIADIVVPDSHRPVNAEMIRSTAKSIKEVGLLNAITVRRVNDQWLLVAGRHRMEACAKLGKSEVPAFVKEYSNDEAMLAEIHENLCRSNMTELEEITALKRCKEIYESMYPQTRKGFAGANGRHNPATAVPSFAKDIADKTGMSQRAVRDKVLACERLSPAAVEIIRGTPVVDNLSELKELGQSDPDTQVEIANEIKAGRAKSVAAAQKNLNKRDTLQLSPLHRFGKLVKATNKAFSLMIHNEETKTKLVGLPLHLRSPYCEDLLELRKQVDELIELFGEGASGEVT